MSTALRFAALRFASLRFVGAAPLWTLAAFWGVTAILILLVDWLVLTDGPAVPPPATATLLAEAEREAADLAQRHAALLRDLEAARAACPIAAGGLAPAPVPGDQGRAPDAEEEQTFDRRLTREGAGSGPVTVSLIWQTRDDLDLFIQCPGGGTVSYKSMNACGGVLDVDMNFQSPPSDEPVENVTWTTTPPPGPYTVVVGHARRRSPGRQPIPFTVRVKIGEAVSVHEGQVSPGTSSRVTTYAIAAGDGR